MRFQYIANGPAAAASGSSRVSGPRRLLLAVVTAAVAVALVGLALYHGVFSRPPIVFCFGDADACSKQTAVATDSGVVLQPALPAASVRPLGPPYFDPLSSLMASPPLAAMFKVNGIRVRRAAVDAEAAQVELAEVGLLAAVQLYEQRLGERLGHAGLRFQDWTDGAGSVNMSRWYSEHAGQELATRSVRNVNYTLSTWHNVCLAFSEPDGPQQQQRRHSFVLLGTDVAANERLIRDTLLRQPHNEFAWLPPRYCNDQLRLRAQAQADDGWLWLPADGDGTAAFHQLEWDFNIGHQFHQQVWPMFQALASHAEFGHPAATAMLLDAGCADASSSIGVRHNAWKPINQMFGRIVLAGVQDRVRLLRQPCGGSGWPDSSVAAGRASGVCFERLLLNDGKDQYLERGGALSFSSFRRLRARIVDSLQLQLSPFPSPAALASTPLRVTIYSRHDSGRRRIVNVEALTAALSPHHIVRHIAEFGTRPAHEQLALYANSDILIAPHGAHMTFAFLLPIDGVVVECFAHEDGKFSWTVAFLAATGHRHIQQVGRAVNDSSKPITPDFRHMDRDFAVDIAHLCRQLRALHIPITYHDC